MIPGLLRRAPFRDFWLGQTISVFGDQITLLAMMGLLTAAGLLPHLFFSLPAGCGSTGSQAGAG